MQKVAVSDPCFVFLADASPTCAAFAQGALKSDSSRLLGPWTHFPSLVECYGSAILFHIAGGLFEKMPSKSPTGPKVESSNPFEDDEHTSGNPFEDSEELEESNPFYEPSPSPPTERSTNPFEVSGEFEEDIVTPTADRMMSTGMDAVDNCRIQNRDKCPEHFTKNLQAPPSPGQGGRKSPRFEKNKGGAQGPRGKSSKAVRAPSPPATGRMSPPGPDSRARSARGSAQPTPRLTKQQEKASKQIAKAVLSPE